MGIAGSPPYAVVLGLDSMQGLQTVRILARRGVPVIGVAADPGHYACRTRECRVVVARDRGELFDFLESFGKDLTTPAVLIPCQDGRVLSVSRARDELSQWYRIVLPDEATVEMLMDKDAFYRFAADRGFPIPETHFVRSRQDAIRAAETLTFPAILKPPFRTSRWTELTPAKAFTVSDKHDLLAVYDRVSDASETIIAQQWIPGGISELYSCNCYFSTEGELLVSFIARKIRQWPPDTGQSSLGEEVRNDVVLEESIRLLRSVGYRGLGYVEMKRDPRTDRYYIIEPNVGRPTGRSAIAEAGGVELLMTMFCDAAGLPLPDHRTQRYTGVKWIHLRRDLLSAVASMRKGELTVREWLRSLRGRKGYAVASWRDPGPFLAEIAQALAIAMGRIFRRKRASS
ncbi:MAG: carboxylate--amine ligase [Acidimicrobiia bacterium]